MIVNLHIKKNIETIPWSGIYSNCLKDIVNKSLIKLNENL